MKLLGIITASLALAAASAAAAQPAADPPAGQHVLEGKAAWYGKKFAGRRTASGQRFDPAALTAAHPTLPFGTKVKITHQKNKRSAVVIINDRGPTTPGRIVDVSLAAARKLGFVRAGLAEVSIEVIGRTPMRKKSRLG